MPKIRPLVVTPAMRRQRLREVMVHQIEGDLIFYRIKKKEVAAAAGVTEQTICNQFKNRNLSMDVLVVCQDMIEQKKGER